MYATIILNTVQAGIGNGLTYRSQQVGRSQVGQLVKAPLRRKLIEGIIVDLQEEKPDGDFDVKEIAEILGDSPLLTETNIATARWMSEYYLCSLKQALSVWLPGGKWQKLLPEAQKQPKGKRRGKKCYDISIPIYHKEISHNWSPESIPEVSLTPRQVVVFKAITTDPRPTLLFGVTGSGKTEMYAALIRDAILKGKSAILLLPEILLTENFIGRFTELLPREMIAIVHSRLTPATRRKAWRGCRDGSIRLVIGSRSALFSPLVNLGLIVIDEEHEWTYKNEQTPRYHVGRVAEIMCCGEMVGEKSEIRISKSEMKMKLVFGSATPSVESWYKAKNGEYQLVELPERYGGAKLPSVKIVDLGSVQCGDYYPLSPTLINAIRIRLECGEQSVLFLNRRGFATSLLCMECRYRFSDPETGLPYTVHHVGRAYLLSHHTGEKLPIPDRCPKCASVNLREVGAGTQRIETLLGTLVPDARLLRADADTMKTPTAMRELLQKMSSGEADILLGTQSVVKGLDLPRVTLAAVLLADIGLSLPHFRAGERVFQLLTQLTGRLGRAKNGEVIIQTYRPRAIEVELAAAHDIRGYLDRELIEREKTHYPPDTDMVRIIFSGQDADEKSKAFLMHVQRSYAPRPTPYTLSRSPSLFRGGKIWHVFLRGKGLCNALKAMPEIEGVIDVDPVECL